MTTTTRVEAITIDSDDGSTIFCNDADLMVNLNKGTALGSGGHLGVVLLRLGIDDCPTVHEVALHSFAQLGTPIDVLNLAIEQLMTARDALERIKAGDDLDEVERKRV